MKREIGECIYDTAEAEVIASHETGSTHIHRMTSLYRSTGGRYFLVEEQEVHGIDGALLTPLSDAMAREWLEKHGKASLASALFSAGGLFLRIEIDADRLCQIDAAAQAAGLTEQEWVLGAIGAALTRVHAAADISADTPEPEPSHPGMRG
ncbi:MAG: hypothetical protein U1E43_00885 [Rhodospirillales bacterium]